jgi:hypothetical protein
LTIFDDRQFTLQRVGKPAKFVLEKMKVLTVTEGKVIVVAMSFSTFTNI